MIPNLSVTTFDTLALKDPIDPFLPCDRVDAFDPLGFLSSVVVAYDFLELVEQF